MRLGILGGTFDPPHVGHLLVATDVAESLGLSRVLFVPNAQQPLKQDRPQSSAAHRLAMTQLLVRHTAAFAVDDMEVARGGLSYSVDTLRALTAREPGAELYFLVGTDAGSTFPKWREPARITEFATIVVMRRAGHTGRAEAEDAVLAPFRAAMSPSGRNPIMVETRRVDVSSTEIRARVAAGKPIVGFVPESVAQFIATHHLYRGIHA